MALSPHDIASELAPEVAAIAIAADPGDWCQSLLFPPGYYEREVIETVEIIGGLRRATVFGELLRVEFNLSQFPPFAEKVRFYLRSMVAPLLEGRGCVCQDAPEGFAIMLDEHRLDELTKDKS